MWAEVIALARKKAAFIVATNILDEQRLSHEQVLSTYKEQGGVERGFRFRNRSSFSRFFCFC
jgi:transposase